jgi:hypothetical protein
VFSDHTDVRPTIMALVGLKDSYVHDGRVLAENLDENAMPHGIQDSKNDFIDLATIYKQLNAPVGSVGTNSLIFANKSIVSDDTTYNQYLATLGSIVVARDALAVQIKTVLDQASFANKRVDHKQAEDLIRQARQIIDRVAALAGNRHHGDDDHHGDNDHHGGDDHHGGGDDHHGDH